MSGRLKPYLTVLIILLLAALVTGPPAAFASKLPTVCNIFDKKTADKAGSCGHRAIFTKTQDKFPVVEAALISLLNFEPRHFLIIQNNPLSVSSPFGSKAQFNPLRC